MHFWIETNEFRNSVCHFWMKTYYPFLLFPKRGCAFIYWVRICILSLFFFEWNIVHRCLAMVYWIKVASHRAILVKKRLFLQNIKILSNKFWYKYFSRKIFESQLNFFCGNAMPGHVAIVYRSRFVSHPAILTRKRQSNR